MLKILLFAQLFGNFRDLIVGYVDLGQVITIPPVFSWDCEFGEIGQLSRKCSQTARLHNKCATLLGSLVLCNQGLAATTSCWGLRITVSSGLSLCLLSTVRWWISANYKILPVSKSSEAAAASLIFKEARICAFSRFHY